MKITGRDLQLVRYGIGLAIDEINNQMITCPDPEHYAKQIAELAEQRDEYQYIADRIDKSLATKPT